MRSSTCLLTKKRSLSVNQPLNLVELQAVIFDVDGTLYDLQKLYRRICLELIQYYSRHPCQLQDIWILHHFIQEREKQTATLVTDLEKAQYEWAAQKTNTSCEKVRQVVKKWIFEMPLKHLYDCRKPDVLKLFDILPKQGIRIAIFSDYPARAKLACLGLSPQCIISSTDPNINQLKPNPIGLLSVANQLDLPVQNCLFIGDRDDRDGECARRAGMPYLILDRNLDLLEKFARVITE
ncbi:MAG: HAD family hydrolase [Leptolyngbya sp. SIO3F4]|nr:HAD family hydrolase [Leptolyngbya sp. SIO3F4]